MAIVLRPQICDVISPYVYSPQEDSTLGRYRSARRHKSKGEGAEESGKKKEESSGARICHGDSRGFGRMVVVGTLVRSNSKKPEEKPEESWENIQHRFFDSSK